MKGIANKNVVGISAYTSPQCITVDIHLEGMLCQSGLYGGAHHNGIDGDDDPIFPTSTF